MQHRPMENYKEIIIFETKSFREYSTWKIQIKGHKEI